MPRLAPLAALAALLWLPACSAVSVDTSVHSGADLTRFHSFVQAAPPQADSASLPGYTPELGQEISAAIAAALEGRGYRAADAAEADLVVAFVVEGEERQSVVVAPFYAGELYGWQSEDTAQSYVTGTLVIDIFDARSQQLLWHGVGETDVFASQPTSGAALEVVQAVLSHFPARQRIASATD